MADVQGFDLYTDVHIGFDSGRHFLVLLPIHKDRKLEHLGNLDIELDFHVCQVAFHAHQLAFQINPQKLDEVLQTKPLKTM
jgi:hypothetical protein